MSKRQPIYILRMEGVGGLTVRGRITVNTSGYLTSEAGRRQAVKRFIKQLASIGIEATPKQQESHR